LDRMTVEYPRVPGSQTSWNSRQPSLP
jgi:hypothetical protein